MRSFVRISGLAAVAAIALGTLLYGIVLNGFGLFEPGRQQTADTAAATADAPSTNAETVPLHPDKALNLPSAPERNDPAAEEPSTRTAALPPPEPAPQRTARNVTPPNVLSRPTSRFGERPREEKPADEEEEPTHLYHRVVVHEPGRLVSGKTTIRLADIAPIAADRTCRDASGHDWPCGHVATAALRRLIRQRAIDCNTVFETAEEITGTCTVGLQNINAWLVEQGWAEADGGAYADEAETARTQKRGIYLSEWTSGQPGSGTASLTAFTPPTVASDPFASTPAPSGTGDVIAAPDGLVPQGPVERPADEASGLVNSVQSDE